MQTPARGRAGSADTAGRDLAAAWEGWWAGLDGTPGEIVWDAAPGDLAADLPRFAAAFGRVLPLVDFGCGDGRQTRYLARHFSPVVGTDLAPAAIGRARGTGPPPGVGYRILDAVDGDAAAGLHAELGDANVYVRGVLQTLPAAARPDAIQTIAILLGTTGTLFAKELPPQAAGYFAGLAARYGMPQALARVMRQIPPGQISENELKALLPAELALPAALTHKWPALTSLEGTPAYNVGRAYAAFAADIGDGTHTVPDFADAVGRHEVIAAIDRSAASGERVKA